MSNYQTLITNIGLAKLADATASGNTVTLTELAVGDGNGVAVTPDADMSGLVNEVWSGPINSISTDQANPSHLNIECIIPTSVGGWWMREVGIFDDEGDLIIIANYPDTHKTLLEDGAAAEFRMMVIAEFTNADTITLQIDPAIVMASKEYVDKSIADIPAVDLSGYATTTYVNDAIASAPSLGVNQSWQDVTDQREIGIIYTNTTDKPIFINLSLYQSGTYDVTLWLEIDGVPGIGKTEYNDSEGGVALSLYSIIPAGSQYEVKKGSFGTLSTWHELR